MTRYFRRSASLGSKELQMPREIDEYPIQDTGTDIDDEDED